MTGWLSMPDAGLHGSFLAALAEYHREGLHLDLDAEELSGPAAFGAWLERLRVAGIAATGGCARDRVPHRVLWWIDDAGYVGRVRLNLLLNAELRDFGGHIGYDVRPSARGRGHATALLRQTLRLAAMLGLEDVLLTCAPANAASRTVIERNGGVLHDLSPAGRLRYHCHPLGLEEVVATQLGPTAF